MNIASFPHPMYAHSQLLPESSWPNLWVFFFNFYLLILEGGRREWETTICCSTYLCIHWLLLVCALTGNRYCNLGVSKWHSNQLSSPARDKHVSVHLNPQAIRPPSGSVPWLFTQAFRASLGYTPLTKPNSHSGTFILAFRRYYRLQYDPWKISMS